MELHQLEDTISAIATPAGHSALAIVRVSGNRSWEIADRVCDKPVTNREKNGTAFRTIVTNENKPIDQAVLILYKAPHSYTGQDMVEFSVHGSPPIVEALLNRLLSEGARPAEPGEFTFRAFWNGKMTLDRAEGVAALIAAEDDASRKGAFRLLDGAVGAAAHELQDDIMAITAKFELMLDFSEEETPVFNHKELRAAILSVIKKLEQTTEDANRTSVSLEGIRIALAGPTNAGKSSLLNRLLAREKAIVSHHPGTTRDVVEGELTLSGRTVKIIDTAGLRESQDDIEREGVRRSRQVHKNADLVLWIHPGNEPMMSNEFDPATPRQWLIINKADLLSPEEKKQWYDGNFYLKPYALLSAKSGIGVRKLIGKLSFWINVNYGSGASESILPMNQRHIKIYRSAAAALRQALRMNGRNDEPELIAQELKSAADVLSEITGVNATDTVLKKIFSGFCIGK